MYLFFNGISSNGYIGLFSPSRENISYKYFSIAGNESSKTGEVIDTFLKENKVKYSELEHIVCVVWPGSFTGVRSVSLVINTLAYIYPHISLTPVNFFDLYNVYPIVKSSSKRDLFVKKENCATIEIVSNLDFESEFNNSSHIYWDTDIWRFESDYILESSVDYDCFMQDLELQNLRKISPLYIKKPNIS